MATKIFLPRLGESVEEAAVGRWCKQIGEPVKRGEVIAELETAKAMMELESPVEGILLAIFPEIGTTIQMGDLVAIVGNADEDWQAELDKEMEKKAQQISQEKEKTVKQRTHKKSVDQVRISPNAKRIARELGVDLQSIAQEKSGERITAEDVRRIAEDLRKNEGGEIPFKRIQLTPVENITAQRMMPTAAVSWLSKAIQRPAGSTIILNLFRTVLSICHRSWAWSSNRAGGYQRKTQSNSGGYFVSGSS